MYEIFLRLCALKGVSPADVSRATGIRESTLSNWKVRGTKLSAKNATIIASYFGVSVDYLTTGQDIERESVDGQKYYFSDETAKQAQELFDNPDLHILMDAARDLSPEKLQALANMAKMLKETNPDG